jgi:hypothetical protein
MMSDLEIDDGGMRVRNLIIFIPLRKGELKGVTLS